MLKHIFVLNLSCLIFAGITGCSEIENTKEINFSTPEDKNVILQQPEEKHLHIAVGGMITPRAGFAYYKKLLDYIGKQLNKTVEFVDKEDYAMINKMMEEGSIDVAFVCGGPYVDGRKEFGMELLAAPHAYGGTLYYSYIIAPGDSPVKNFEELRGKAFAFTDPLSNTGKLVPTYMLAKMDETPDSFFKSYDYTYAHDKSIKAVATGLVDGAAVDSLIWEYANQTNPEHTSKTKIIKRSPPYGIPPVVVRAGLDSNCFPSGKFGEVAIIPKLWIV
jgi:phosphonate transport system substrate-binding protein